MFPTSIKFSKPGKYTLWRLASIIVTGLLGCGALLTYFFIYQNIFSLISEANIIMVLSSNLNLDLLDMDAYKRVNTVITQKKAPVPIPEHTRNIFIYEGAATSTVKKN